MSPYVASVKLVSIWYVCMCMSVLVVMTLISFFVRACQFRNWKHYNWPKILALKLNWSLNFGKGVKEVHMTSVCCYTSFLLMLSNEQLFFEYVSICTSTCDELLFLLLYFHQVQTWWSVMKVTSWRTKRLPCPKRWILSGRGGELCWPERLCKTTSLNVSLPGYVDDIRLSFCVVVDVSKTCDRFLLTRPLHGEFHQGEPAWVN